MNKSFESSRAPEPIGWLSRIRRAGPQLVLGLLLGVFVLTGWIGLDYGTHWDEGVIINQVTRPLRDGILLPGSYHYPSMLFNLGTVALLPETIPFLLRAAKESTPANLQSYQDIVPKAKIAPIVSFAQSKPFLLRLRGMFLLLTSLTGVWVFLAVRACKRSGWEATCAAAVVLTSWELAYHARWVAPDAIQMQFVALWLMFFAFALHSSSHSRLWLRLSAAAAGLACGTKYQGAIFLLPVLVQTVRALSPSYPVRAVAKELMCDVGIFLAVFIWTTPGLFLEPLVACQGWRAIGHHYVTGHYGYTVSPVGQHAYLLFVYLTCVLTSHWPVAAVVLAAAACLGVARMWKEQRLVAMLLLGAPLAYVCFVVCYRVMIVRNYLLLAPFIAVLSARGAFYVWKSLASAIWIRRTVVACLIVLFASDMIFLCFAAHTVRIRSVTPFGADIVAYLKKHSTQQYFLSPKVAEVVAKENASLSNTTRDPKVAQRCMLFLDDLAPEQLVKWSCNRLGHYQIVSGPVEVNFDYYATWYGVPMVVELPMRRARKMRLLE